MTQRNIRGRLELTWMGKDQALIPTTQGAYDYTWVPKNDPRACQTHYLINDGHVGDPTDGGIHDNLLITGESGDVLEALTRVPELAEKYVGQVKAIYIDPPFNTGNVFTSYEDNLEHSVWLTFMRDRLILLKKLLADDGSIWVHLDDSENHRMRALLDEIFGPANSVCTIVWEKNPTRENRTDISRSQDYIHVYVPGGREVFKQTRNLLPQSQKQLDLYSNPDNDARGVWSSLPMHAKAEKGRRAEQFYTVTTPSGRRVDPPAGRCWLYTEDRYEELLADNRITFGDDGTNVPRIKKFLSEVQQGLVPRTWWSSAEVGSSGEAKDEIVRLFPQVSPFSTPKPERLLERVLQIATNPGDIVLDCFAGSGTTAAVAHKMGRRWVTCELQKDTMADFTRPRLEKVVTGQDLGGITTSVRYEAKSELPPRTTVTEAREFNTILKRAVDAAKEAGVTLDPVTIKSLKDATATEKVTTVNWTQGGGFDVAHLSPVWVGVEVDDFTGATTTFITPEATGEVLERSVAGHLGFRLEPVSPRFTGVKGKQHLAVIEGQLSESLLDELFSDLPDGHSLTVVCDGAAPGIDKELRKRARGSRLLLMPDDLFTSRGND